MVSRAVGVSADQRQERHLSVAACNHRCLCEQTAQIEAIAGVQERLAASSSAWVGAAAAWIGEDVTPFHPISPAWVQRRLADQVAVMLLRSGVTNAPGGSLGPR
jgi:hypothetical protein